MKDHTSRRVVFAALSANLVIAAVKYVVAVISGSSAMLAEAIHSTTDTLNQVLLLVGMRGSRRRADELHPFGFAGESYFWSFIVAIMLFTMGAVFSVWEGVHKLLHPEPIENVLFVYIVLLFAMAAEGYSFWVASREVNRQRRSSSVLAYLRQTKKSALIVVFLEDFAALTGLLTALVLVGLQQLTGVLVFDGIASIIIGGILGTVAVFLGREIKSLLIGESADPALVSGVVEIVRQAPAVQRILDVRTLQMGPDEVLLALKLEFAATLHADQISDRINEMEVRIRARYPEARRIFIEPDVYRDTAGD